VYDSKFTKLPNKIFELGLGPVDIAVFCAIASHGGQNGNSIFPSQLRLSRMAGCSVPSVKRSLKRLREHRILNWDAGSGGRSSTYFLNEIGLWVGRGVGSIRTGGGSIRTGEGVLLEPLSSSYRAGRGVLLELQGGSIRATNHTHRTQTHINQTHEPVVLGEEFESAEEDQQRIREFAKMVTRGMRTTRELD
jgi:hypothetical protein